MLQMLLLLMMHNYCNQSDKLMLKQCTEQKPDYKEQYKYNIQRLHSEFKDLLYLEY